LLNSWQNVGAPWAAAAYRLVGDMVQFRGLISRPTSVGGVGTSSTMFVLPLGFRPPAGVILSVNCAGANYGDTQIRIDVQADGTVYMYVGSTAQNPQAYTSLTGAQFSVTA
jgi:hypothetical protein